jgi:AmpE protein
MYLLAIIVSLGIERLINPGFFLHRFSWFPSYADYFYQKLATSQRWQGALGLVLILAPLLCVSAILFYGLGAVTNQMLQALMAIIVLIYCLGPEDSRRQLEGYIRAKDDKDSDRAVVYASQLLSGVMPADEHVLSRALTEASLLHFVKQVFAVIIWFIFLGPLGALLYRLSNMLERYAQARGMARLQLSSGKLIAVMEWPVIRLLGFSFALVGSFSNTFAFACQKCFTSGESAADDNTFFLTQVGLLALDADLAASNQASLSENQAVLDLFDRVLVIWLAAIALVTIGLLVI